MAPNTTEWYDSMAKASRKRDHALQMLERWEKAVDEAEKEIYDLTQLTRNEVPENVPTVV
jgi:hypothetical protein